MNASAASVPVTRECLSAVRFATRANSSARPLVTACEFSAGFVVDVSQHARPKNAARTHARIHLPAHTWIAELATSVAILPQNNLTASVSKRMCLPLVGSASKSIPCSATQSIHTTVSVSKEQTGFLQLLPLPPSSARKRARASSLSLSLCLPPSLAHSLTLNVKHKSPMRSGTRGRDQHSFARSPRTRIFGSVRNRAASCRRPGVGCCTGPAPTRLSVHSCDILLKQSLP